MINGFPVAKNKILVLRDSLEENIAKLIDVYPNPTGDHRLEF